MDLFYWLFGKSEGDVAVAEKSYTSTDDIETSVYRIIKDHHHNPKLAVRPESKFMEDLSYDSMDVLEFAMYVEKEFDINITEAEALKFITVQDAVDYLRQRRRQHQL